MANSRVDRPFVIGVTGNIACGKSAVVAMLSELGADTIDSDVIYHHLIEPGKPLWKALKDHFGDGIIAGDRTIDRQALSRIVFSNPRALRELDALTHPSVVTAVMTELAASPAAIVAIDAVKLVESGMARLCDAVWLVECSPEMQLERLMKRNGLRREDALRRIAAQPPIESKRSLASEIIDNSGTPGETRRLVNLAWSRLPILPI